MAAYSRDGLENHSQPQHQYQAQQQTALYADNPRYNTPIHTALALPHANDRYTYRVPTPPRIVVPPPSLKQDATPDLTLTIHPSSPIAPLIQSLELSNLVAPPVPLGWTYEQRHRAQAILPFLYLGPMTSAKDEAFLQREHISMLLGIRQSMHNIESRLMQAALRTAEKLNIAHAAVDLPSPQALVHQFPAATDLINAHLLQMWNASGGAATGRVLVFCESGNERSACVVAAYLMAVFANVDYITAMQICQVQRLCVNFDDHLKHLLQGYWDILMAQRGVAAASSSALSQQAGVPNTRTTGFLPPAAHAYTQRAKRSLEYDEDEYNGKADDVDVDVDGHDEMTETRIIIHPLPESLADATAYAQHTTPSMHVDPDDRERFSGRRSFAPFTDQEM